MRKAEQIQRVARALARMVNEHGRPNSFSPAEVESMTNVLAMHVGLIARYDWYTLGQELKAHGLDGPIWYDTTRKRFVTP